MGLFITGDTPDEGFREKQNKAFTQWGAMVNWDHQEHLAGGDGWHAYSEDGVKAWTETLLGLGAGGLAGRTLLRRGRHSRVLPKGVRTGLTHLHNATTALSQPWLRFKHGIRQFALDHVVNPLDDKLRVLAEQARRGLEEVADPWRNTALAGAGGPGGRGGSGMWDDPHTALSHVDTPGGGRGGGPDVVDADPVPRRADPGLPEGDLPGTEVPEVEPPRRTDRYGNELIVDDHGQPMVQERHDGRLHYASDPEGTFRDNQGVLHHWLDGKFVEDPYKIPGYIAEHASWDIPPRDYPLPDADITPEWQTLRENARTARAAAADSVKFAEEWITHADSKSYNALAQGLDRRKSDPNLTAAQRAEIEQHRRLLEDAHKAELDLQHGSEWAGDRGGHLVLEDQGHQVILGGTGSSPGAHSSPGAGAFDQVGISGPGIEVPGGKRAGGDRYVMTFQENKGGNSPQLGSRNSAQQGTLSYLQDLVANNSDPRLGDTLRQLRDQGRHPGFFDALARGEVVVRYQYTNARTNGTLRAGLFNLGAEVRIRWDGTTLELLPTKEPS